MSDRKILVLDTVSDLSAIIAKAKAERWSALAVDGPAGDDELGFWIAKRPDLTVYRLKRPINNLCEKIATLTDLKYLWLRATRIGNDGAKALSSLRGLNELFLRYNEIGTEGAQALSKLTGLSSLSISNNPIGPEGAQAFCALINLTVLDLSNTKINAGVISALSSLAGLTELWLQNDNIGDEEVQALYHLATLSELYLGRNQIGVKGAQALCGLTGLTVLDLDGNKIGDEGAKAVGSLTGLTKLWLKYNEIGDNGTQALRYLTNLSELYLSGNRIGTKGVQALSRLTGLTALDLDSNKIGSDSVKSLSSLTSLTKLWLGGNEIGDEGTQVLSTLANLTGLYLNGSKIGVKGAQALGGLTALTALHLDSNRIGADGANSLSSLTGLTKLWLTDNEIGDDGAQALSTLTNLRELYVGGNQIGVEGVQALCGLTDLTDLDLDRNKIGVDGAKSLSALTDLTGLWLGSNGIGDGGVRALCRLTNLTVLDLRFNKIGVDAVKSLSSLTGLTALGLWGNEIGDEGAEALRPLTNLTELYLGYNQIGVKGAQALCGLTGLTILNLDDNEIEVDGAKSLSSLTGLTKLWLGDNEVGDEGAQALSALINLTELYLSNAQISSKGARALRKLSRLTILDLDGNKIGKLGAKSLSSLIGLTKLRLAENGISDEGARALGKLTNLTELFLQNNDIENDGAVAIGALTNLNVLDLEGNEIGSEGAKALLDALAFASPPSRLKTLELTDGVASSVSLTPELLRSGEAQAIFAAYRAAREAAKTSTSAQWNTAKLLVVGDETAGKTSLIKFLVHNEPRDPNQTKTSGIDLRERVDITRWAQGGTDITLNIWDFAGQVRTHGTHRFFFSERCLYLLVLQDRLEDDRSIDYWLKAILNRAGNAPILVVINKSDQGKNNLRLDEARYQRECSNIIGFLRTSCNDDPWARNSIASLRSVIGRTMTHPQLTHVRDPIPRHWLRVRDQLAQRTSAERVITISEFRNLCRSAASTMENPSDELFSEAGQRALLIQLHYIGVVVAYGIDASAPAATREITLLDPNWLITAVYSVLEQPALRDQNGRFWRTDLEKWLNPMEYPKDRHEFIVSQMLTEDVHLCFRLPEEKDAYLVPAALPATAPDYGKWPEFSWSSAALRFRYRYSLLPNDLITRFLVEAHRRLTDQPTLWATGAVLQAAECRILVTADLDRRCIDVLVDAKGKSQNRRRDALNRLQDDFETVHNFYKQNAPDARVPLPDDPGLDEQYEHLLNLEQRMGRDYEHWPSGAKRSYKVCELLDGVRREDYSGSFEKQIAAMRSVPARGQPMARRDKVDQTSPGLLVGQRAQPRRRIAKPPAPRTTTPPVDLLLVTVNPHETKQLIKAFEEGTGSKAQPVQKNRRLYRDLGTINGTRVFHALSGMGSAGPGGTQQTVDKAIRALRPQAVICVGIAFGINDKNQSIGDILIAKQLRLYDLQRIGKRIMLRGEKPSASTWLINVFESIAQTSWEGAPVLSGVMLTGQKLVDNFNYRKQLLGFEPEAIGGEMEGAGVYVACDDMKIDWIVVKAICDWGDGTKSKNKASRQRRAARNAADFLMHALKYAPLTLGNRRRRQPA